MCESGFHHVDQTSLKLMTFPNVGFAPSSGLFTIIACMGGVAVHGCAVVPTWRLNGSFEELLLSFHLPTALTTEHRWMTNGFMC